MPRVRIEAGSRLHAGFYHIGSSWNVAWASAGFYIDLFNTIVEAWECSDPRVEAPSELDDVVALVTRAVGVQTCARVLQYAPRHMGLGSTTQASMALAEALMRASGRDVDRHTLASKLSRARVSGVGVLAYIHGGFVADAGRPWRSLRHIMRLDVPEEWRFLIVIPSVGRGPSEAEEPDTVPEPSERARLLMASGLLRLASGIARGDIGDALRGLAEIDSGTGLSFSSHQGGVYRGDVAWIAEEASKNGVTLVQSSWGPVLYTIEASEEDALADMYLVKGLLSEAGVRGQLYIARPRNKPASVYIG